LKPMKAFLIKPLFGVIL